MPSTCTLHARTHARTHARAHTRTSTLMEHARHSRAPQFAICQQLVCSLRVWPSGLVIFPTRVGRSCTLGRSREAASKLRRVRGESPSPFGCCPCSTDAAIPGGPPQPSMRRRRRGAFKLGRMPLLRAVGPYGDSAAAAAAVGGVGDGNSRRRRKSCRTRWRKPRTTYATGLRHALMPHPPLWFFRVGGERTSLGSR